MPRMLYKAHKLPNGKVLVINYDQPDENPTLLQQTTLVVRSEEELRLALSLGWRTHPVEALELFEQEEQEIANAAAERAYDDRNMSEAAKAEAAVYDESGALAHVPEIPEGPKKRGRSKKS